MIKLANPKTIEVSHFPCPHCSKSLRHDPRLSGRPVQCPGCSNSLRMPLALSNPTAPTDIPVPPVTKVGSTRWLFALFALVLIGAAAFAVYWYQQPQSSPTSTTKVINPADKTQDPLVADEAVNEIGEEIDEDLVLKFGDDSVAIPEPPSPDLSELTALQPIVPDIPIAKPNIKLEPLKVEQKPQPVPPAQEEQPSTTIQPFGGLTWDDDLLTASQKMLALTDSKSIAVSSERAVNEHSLLSTLRSQLRASYTVLGIDKPVAYRGWLHLEGYPVIISQGAFQINLSFICEPGYALDHADECLAHARQILGLEADCYLPLHLQRVQLILKEDTKSRTLNTDARKNTATQIYNQLKTKYASSEHFTSTASAYEATWQDRSKNKLLFYANHKHVRLVYERNTSDLSKLSQKLQKLQDEIKEKEHQDRFVRSEDKSNKL